MSVVLIVGTEKGGVLCRSDDARRSWEVGPLQFPGWRVTAAARDAGGRTYLGFNSAAYGSAILASDDLASWEHLESAPRYRPGEPGNLDHNRTVGFNNLQLDPREGDTNPLGVYAYRHVDQIWKLHCVGDRVFAGVSEAGLFTSDDRGKSWQPVSGLNDHESRPGWMPGFGGLCLHSILGDPADPARMWVGISSVGVLRTEDGGETWHKKDDGVPHDEAHCVHGLAHDPQRPEHIFRQDHRGVFRTRDGGDSWQRIEGGLPRARLFHGHECAFGFAVDVDPGSGSVFVFPLSGDDFRYPPEGRMRVYRSRDAGESWEPLERGLPREPRYTNVLRGAMSVDGMDPCGVYFGTTSGHVFTSPDCGESWSELPCTLPKILCVEAFRV